MTNPTEPTTPTPPHDTTTTPDQAATLRAAIEEVASGLGDVLDYRHHTGHEAEALRTLRAILDAHPAPEAECDARCDGVHLHPGDARYVAPEAAPPTRGMTPLYRALFPRIEAAALAERNPSTLAETVVDLVEDYLADAPPTLTPHPAVAWAEGHRTGWEHCQDGNYGTDAHDDDTPNPYDSAAPPTLTVTREQASTLFTHRLEADAWRASAPDLNGDLHVEFPCACGEWFDSDDLDAWQDHVFAAAGVTVVDAEAGR